MQFFKRKDVRKIGQFTEGLASLMTFDMFLFLAFIVVDSVLIYNFLLNLKLKRSRVSAALLAGIVAIVSVYATYIGTANNISLTINGRTFGAVSMALWLVMFQSVFVPYILLMDKVAEDNHKAWLKKQKGKKLLENKKKAENEWERHLEEDGGGIIKRRRKVS